jgi:hypothetical protein
MQKVAKCIVAVNARGSAIGEDHPRAALTNHEAQLLLELRDEGYGYGWLAGKFEISKRAVRAICSGKTYGQHPAGYVRQRRQTVRLLPDAGATVPAPCNPGSDHSSKR